MTGNLMKANNCTQEVHKIRLIFQIQYDSFIVTNVHEARSGKAKNNIRNIS